MSTPTPELAGSLSHPRVLPPSLCALRDGEGDGKQAPEAHGATTSQKIPDQPVAAAGPQGAAPEPLRESVPRDTAQGIPCAPPPGPEGASPAMPESSTAAPLLKAQAPPMEQGPDQPVPPGTPASSAARHDPSHPAKPPRSKATKGAGREPRGPSSAPWDPSLAKASPDSPKGTSVPEQDGLAPDSHPERPLPADHKLCLSGVDTSALPKRTACPSLQEAMRLIQEEFAFDGYLDNGLEALIMGIMRGWAQGSPEKPQDQGEARGNTVTWGRISVKGTWGPHSSICMKSSGGRGAPRGIGQQQSLRQEEGLRAWSRCPGFPPALIPSCREQGTQRGCSPTS